MSIDRGARGDVRQRRMWQRLAEGLGVTYAPPLSYDESSNTLSLSVGEGVAISGDDLVATSLFGIFYGGSTINQSYPITADGIGDGPDRAASWMGL